MSHQKSSDQKCSRLCDYCNQSKALLYCKADSAKLCLPCDREVHSANSLFTKHSRSQLCDACDNASASIFCETEQAVFCSNCDWETHKPSFSSLHNRRPIEGFNGCPSVTELVSFTGIEDLGDKNLFLSGDAAGGEDDELFDLLMWEPPVISGLDDLIVSSDFGHGFNPTDVPSLPKNRNASCGQHKDDMLHQLRELAKSEPNICIEKTDNTEAITRFQSLLPHTDNLQAGSLNSNSKKDTDPIPFPAYESCGLPFAQLRSFTEESAVVPDKHVDTCKTTNVNDSHEDQLQHYITARSVPALPKIAMHELNSQERDSAISRYQEKKKTRRYDKHIRYESRKVRAESRTRIKGRFAKVMHRDSGIPP